MLWERRERKRKGGMDERKAEGREDEWRVMKEQDDEGMG
jgi:hypothetical protein